MRVVIAPDTYAGTASAAEAAAALARGWRTVAPADECVLLPLSDGGPGLVEVLAASLSDAELVPVEVSGPARERRRVPLLRHGATGYVESALACGLDLVLDGPATVETATTVGVGELVVAAAGLPGVRTVVVGLGGSGTNDGGAGAWSSLGAHVSASATGRLDAGGAGLNGLVGLTVPSRLGVDLVAATDVNAPLLGLYGASAVFGPQKGADRAAMMRLESALERWADAVEPAVGRPGLRVEPGAGAAGGLGFGLLALGARRVSGIDLVAEAVGLAAAVQTADLVVTGEGRLDPTSLTGKVVSGVARVAVDAGVPCVAAAGSAALGQREAAAHGLDEVWSVSELVGGDAAALAAGTAGIEALGAALARVWSRG